MNIDYPKSNYDVLPKLSKTSKNSIILACNFEEIWLYPAIWSPSLLFIVMHVCILTLHYISTLPLAARKCYTACTFYSSSSPSVCSCQAWYLWSILRANMIQSLLPDWVVHDAQCLTYLLPQPLHLPLRASFIYDLMRGNKKEAMAGQQGGAFDAVGLWEHGICSLSHTLTLMRVCVVVCALMYTHSFCSQLIPVRNLSLAA